MTDDLRTLIAYRMEQAEDALRAADLLLNEGLWRDVVNRAYYGLHWPDLDEDLSVDGLIGAVHSSPLAVAEDSEEYKAERANKDG
jgi:hypothetical protein